MTLNWLISDVLLAGLMGVLAWAFGRRKQIIFTRVLWSQGPNFIALLTAKQIFVLTIAEKFALKT